MSELLPCPFCGEKRIFINEPIGREKGSVNCPACLAVIPGAVRGPKGRDELIGCWNARAAVAAMPVSEPGVREALVILDAKISALKKIGGWQTAEHRVNEIDIVIGYLIGAREEIAALAPASEAQP